jgi:hypothetical protein
VVPIHKKGDKTDCSKHRGISLLSTSYKILTNILLARRAPYSDELTGDHQCGLRCNRSTNDKIFYIRQILEKNGSIKVHHICYLYITGKPTIHLGGKCYTVFSLSFQYPEN